MSLSDHLRPLLRNHDCVIIPDFGGLVAEYTAAKVQPAGRHLLSPPTRQVAFNQALTRNDGLLVDALRQQLGLSAAEAREHLRQAVAALHHELQAQQRTELPGIGVFRQLAGRGLQFEYTGTENLLAAAFGLPELTAQPVAVIDARQAREQQAQLVPRLRSVAQRGSRVPLRQLMRGGAIGLAAGLVAAAGYLLSLHPTVLPVAWQGYLPRWEQAGRTLVPQQATLAHTGLGPASSQAAPPTELLAELNREVDSKEPVKEKETNNGVVEMPTVVLKGGGSEATAPAPAALAPASVAAPAAKASAPVATSPVAKPVAASKPILSFKHSKALAVAAPSSAAKAKEKTVSVAKAGVATTAPTIKARTGRFYVVVGAFSTLAGAERGRRDLVRTGRPAPQTKIILPFPGTRHYRISAADFASRGEALAAAARLRQNPHLDEGLSVFGY